MVPGCKLNSYKCGGEADTKSTDRARTNQPLADADEAESRNSCMSCLPPHGRYLHPTLNVSTHSLLAITARSMAIPLHEILSSTEELYRSLPLPGRSIRVLRLNRLKRGQTDAEPLRCQLKIVHLDKRPRFDCLSYVWGSGLPGEHMLKCGSCDIPIGVNLHAVLVQLRRQFGDITIWIDAVCIDQQNDEEKNRQIPLMGEVYSLAQRVYVWLGSGTEESDLAMDWIRFASNSILGHPYKNLFGLQAMWNIVSCSTSLMFGMLQYPNP